MFSGRQNGHLSTRQVQRLLDEIATRAGLQDERPVLQRSRKRISPHLLRHSAASWWLDAGIHIGDVAGQLGHASLSTTTCYVDRAPNHRREASDGPEWIRCYNQQHQNTPTLAANRIFMYNQKSGSLPSLS